VTEQIVARVEGRPPDPVHARYQGKVRCWLEVGGGRATMVGFDYGGPTRIRKPSRAMYAAKWLFNRAYWQTVPKGRF
jgi:sulfide:quinone oxidoreductase